MDEDKKEIVFTILSQVFYLVVSVIPMFVIVWAVSVGKKNIVIGCCIYYAILITSTLILLRTKENFMSEEKRNIVFLILLYAFLFIVTITMSIVPLLIMNRASNMGTKNIVVACFVYFSIMITIMLIALGFRGKAFIYGMIFFCLPLFGSQYLKYSAFVKKEHVAKQHIGLLLEGLNDYKSEYGKYPSTEQGMNVLLKHGFKMIPKDPWGNQYYYQSNGLGCKITSYGPDGEKGGMGKDISFSHTN